MCSYLTWSGTIAFGPHWRTVASFNVCLLLQDLTSLVVKIVSSSQGLWLCDALERGGLKRTAACGGNGSQMQPNSFHLSAHAGGESPAGSVDCFRPEPTPQTLTQGPRGLCLPAGLHLCAFALCGWGGLVGRAGGRDPSSKPVTGKLWPAGRSGPLPLVWVKFYWNAATHICLWLLLCTKAGLSSHITGMMALQMEGVDCPSPGPFLTPSCKVRVPGALHTAHAWEQEMPPRLHRRVWGSSEFVVSLTKKNAMQMKCWGVNSSLWGIALELLQRFALEWVILLVLSRLRQPGLNILFNVPPTSNLDSELFNLWIEFERAKKCIS